MRRPLVIAATAATAGAAFAAGLVALPAVAGTSTPSPAPSSTTCPFAESGAGNVGAGGRGMMNGRRPAAGDPAARGGMMAGPGRGAGMTGGMMGGAWSGDPLAGLAKGTLTAEQKARLAGMAEEEKLAHDVYTALAAGPGDVRFARIAAAETRHLSEVHALLARYGIADPTAGKVDGEFATPGVQQQYRDLVARGKTSPDAAFAVGRDIENADLKDLAAAGSGVTARDVTTVYARLSAGSRMHLRAFGG